MTAKLKGRIVKLSKNVMVDITLLVVATILTVHLYYNGSHTIETPIFSIISLIYVFLLTIRKTETDIIKKNKLSHIALSKVFFVLYSFYVIIIIPISNIIYYIFNGMYIWMLIISLLLMPLISIRISKHFKNKLSK